MKKIFSKLALASTGFLLSMGALSTLSAQAASFNFSYTFNSGETLSGMVDGDLLPDGDTVVNLDNLMASYSGGGGIDFSFLLSESERLFTLSGNRILFFGTNFPNPGAGEGFSFRFGTNSPADGILVGEGDADGSSFGLNSAFETESFNADRWVVTEKNLEAVPEPSSLLALLGVAAMGYGVKKKTV